VSRLEDRLGAALTAGTAAVSPSPDLFERVAASIVGDGRRRRAAVRGVGVGVGVVGALVAAAAALSEIEDGRIVMEWWVLEVLVVVALGALVLWLGPFIKRFGKSYAADVFRSNPGTGKSFIVLTDVAYYLVFGAYLVLTAKVDRPGDWGVDVGAEQVQHELVRGGGLLLVIGVLHGANLVLLPVIGRLLTLNRRLDQQMVEHERGQADED
jgi:hypothetical protein